MPQFAGVCPHTVPNFLTSQLFFIPLHIKPRHSTTLTPPLGSDPSTSQSRGKASALPLEFNDRRK